MKLKRVMRIDSIPIGNTYFNDQGFLHDTPIVTSTGIFEYAQSDGSIRRELRLPEHVFDSQSLASYLGKPVIITHNAGSIDKDNVMKEIVGTIISEGYQDGNDVRCKIVIHDIDKVKNVPYRELSLGYSLDLIEEPGTWNGQPYDAIQTNIRINHLAIVDNARAGEQAHLNLDGETGESDDIENLKGGKTLETNLTNKDSIDITAEELIEAINNYKASKENAPEENVDPATDGVKPSEETPAAEPKPVVNEPTTETEAPKTDSNEKIISLLENLLTELKGTTQPIVEDGKCGINDDSSEDKSESMNMDADDLVEQKLNICRIGDKLGMTGLEKKSLIDGKKAIIANVLPEMRLDGKTEDYINAAFDMAVCKANERKDANYQIHQMSSNIPDERHDGNVSMAVSARQRMLDREGGNE